MLKKIKMEKQVPTLEELLQLFIRHCKVKNLSGQTIETYQTICGFFLKWASPDTPVSQISKETVEDYVLYLREETNIAETTINTYLRHMRALLYYAMDCDYLPRFKIKLIKTDKEIKQTYTDEELDRLLQKPNIRQCRFTEFEVWTLENFLLATGMRISSALNVRIEDVNFQEHTILIRKAKNRKQQTIPLSPALADILHEYLSYRAGDANDYLFCNSYGNRACTRTMQQNIARYNISRNVNKTSAHLFRHTYAKNFILAGGDVFRLQKLLGHSDISVTREYVEMFGKDLQRDYENFCPLDMRIRR